MAKSYKVVFNSGTTTVVTADSRRKARAQAVERAKSLGTSVKTIGPGKEVK